jgi:hypothetical protein
MRRVATSRADDGGLLARPPCPTCDADAPTPGLDPVAQVTELAALWSQGLVSREEFERQASKVVRSVAR